MNRRRNFLYALIFFILIFSVTFWALAQTSVNLTVKNRDSFVTDANNNGLADTGDVIRYTVIVANCGSEIAQNTQYDSSIDSNTRLNTNSVRVSNLEGITPDICPPSTSNTSGDTSSSDDDDTPVSVN